MGEIPDGTLKGDETWVKLCGKATTKLPIGQEENIAEQREVVRLSSSSRSSAATELAEDNQGFA